MMLKVGSSSLSSSEPPSSSSSSDTLFYSDQCLDLGVSVARCRESQIGDVTLESTAEALPPRKKGKKKRAVTTGEVM